MRRAAGFIAAILLAAGGSRAVAGPATLILHDAEVWTVDDARPAAQAVAIEGERIVRVGSDAEVLALKGPQTRLVDLHGAFVLPGLIDAHTHFGNAVEAFFQVRLVDVDAGPLLVERLAAAAADIPQGLWITGYDWSGAAANAARRRGVGGRGAGDGERKAGVSSTHAKCPECGTRGGGRPHSARS